MEIDNVNLALDDLVEPHRGVIGVTNVKADVHRDVRIVGDVPHPALLFSSPDLMPVEATKDCRIPGAEVLLGE